MRLGFSRARARIRTRLYVIPTKAGLAFFFFIIAEILMSAIYSSASLQLLGFFLLGLYALAMTWTHAELRGVIPTRIEIQSGPANHQVRLLLCVNSKWDLERNGLFVLAKFHHALDPKKKYSFEIPLISLKGKGDLRTEASLILKGPRGHWICDRLSVYSESPFGLFHVWFRSDQRPELWIYPALLSYTPRPAGGYEAGQKSIAEGEDDFAELRESHQIASASRVAARPPRDGSVLLIKEFQSEVAQNPSLDWRELTGDFETKLSLCAGAVWSAKASLDVITPDFRGRITNFPTKEAALKAWALAMDTK